MERKPFFTKRCRRSKGLVAIEYASLAALIAILSVGLIRSAGFEIESAFGNAAESIASNMEMAGGSSGSSGELSEDNCFIHRDQVDISSDTASYPDLDRTGCIFYENPTATSAITITVAQEADESQEDPTFVWTNQNRTIVVDGPLRTVNTGLGDDEIRIINPYLDITDNRGTSGGEAAIFVKNFGGADTLSLPGFASTDVVFVVDGTPMGSMNIRFRDPENPGMFHTTTLSISNQFEYSINDGWIVDFFRPIVHIKFSDRAYSGEEIVDKVFEDGGNTTFTRDQFGPLTDGSNSPYAV